VLTRANPIQDRLLDKESELVCFFDMGDTQTQCAVMRYSKGKLEVLGYGYDHHLGGRNFTAAIAEHFRQEWKVRANRVSNAARAIFLFQMLHALLLLTVWLAGRASTRLTWRQTLGQCCGRPRRART
jgi:molecular chaperone DnaK (HSP70)